MEEIIDHIHYEIKNSDYEKKLIGGIVLTGGGALLKHLVQLTEFITGMDTRVGYPNEHLARDVPDEMASPMYSTGTGLVIEGFRRLDKEKEKGQVQDGKKKGKLRPAKTPRPKSFLSTIQEWFEKDQPDE
jgi:cell division protein FtsA